MLLCLVCVRSMKGLFLTVASCFLFLAQQAHLSQMERKLFPGMLPGLQGWPYRHESSHELVPGRAWLFVFYIIPLAKKLKRCGVFGVASDEYLNYAVRNRKEWHDRGQQVVEEMIQAIAPTKPASTSFQTETEAIPLTTTTNNMNSVLEQSVSEVQSDRKTLGSLSPERAPNSTEVFLDEENHV